MNTSIDIHNPLRVEVGRRLHNGFAVTEITITGPDEVTTVIKLFAEEPLMICDNGTEDCRGK